MELTANAGDDPGEGGAAPIGAAEAEAAVVAQANEQTFKRSVAFGVRWATVALVGKQLGRALISVVLARLLGPHNDGIVGEATVYTLLISFLLDGGFGAAYIQRRSVGDDELGTVWLYSAVSTVAMVGLTWLIAPAMAAFFHTPELAGVLRWLALDVVFVGLAIAPTAILTRALRLKRLASAEVASMALGGIAGVVAAYAGAGYWALVIYAVIGDAAFLLVTLSGSGLPRIRVSASSLREMGGFGSNVILAQVLYYLLRNSDNLFVGRYLGATALGYYTLGYGIVMVPQQTLGYMINRVALPVFSRLQDRRDELGRYFLRATTTLAAVSFPALALVAAAARKAVPLFFGRRWLPAVVPMEILAIAAFMSTVQHLMRPVLYACRRQKVALYLQSAQTGAAIIGFAVAVHWGIRGIALVVLCLFWSFQPAFILFVGRECRVSPRRYVTALTPAIASSMGLIAAFLGTQRVLRAAALPGLVILTCTSIAGLGAYIAIMRLAWPRTFEDAVRAIRSFIQPGRPSPNPYSPRHLRQS